MKLPSSTFTAVLATVGLLFATSVVRAVPSFARQMNMQCTACHTDYPILNDFGRQFKLSGYTMSTGQSSLPPISFMLEPTYSSTQRGQPGGAGPGFNDNNNFALNQASIFYAGRLFGDLAGADPTALANKFGVFIQATYDGVGKAWHWDNAEVRFADRGTVAGRDVSYGVYANNNPTLQDPWNSTPVWSFPFNGSALAPTPAGAPLIAGGTDDAQKVGGVGTYAMIANSVYLDVGAYRTLGTQFQKRMGVDPATETEIPSFAPYWRVALQRQVGGGTWEVGAFGMAADTYPQSDHTVGKDHYVDVGFDSQYQCSIDQHDVTAMLSYIYEDQKLGASQVGGYSTNASNSLWALKGTVDYLYDKTYGGAVKYFIADGTRDPVLYQSGAAGGSLNGSPLSDGLIMEVNYLPFAKGGGPAFWPKSSVKFLLQYTVYDRFNGARNNYDGTGRNARDNNTLFLEAWILF